MGAVRDRRKRLAMVAGVFLSGTVLCAQHLVIPEVTVPAVEMPNVAMAMVIMPGERNGAPHESGSVLCANGVLQSSWTIGAMHGRIQLYEMSGAPGIVLGHWMGDTWQSLSHGTGTTRWKLDGATGSLKQMP